MSSLPVSSLAYPCTDVPRDQFAEQAYQCVSGLNAALVLMFATDERREHGAFAIHAVFSLPKEQTLRVLRTVVTEEEGSYPSLTPRIMAAHWYERLIQDQFGILAEGHPDPRRLVHHETIPAGTFPLRKEFAWNTKLPYAKEPYPMHAVEGQGIYEIPVGPIHAGIIEPGHFRFNVHGERILTLEGKLFFKHKGVEKLMEGKTAEEGMAFAERVTGNMRVAHAIAYAEAVEQAAGVTVPKRARYLRTLLLELERITMHVFDIGNMGGNGTGFTFMVSQCFRLVEDLRTLHEEVFGHRFLSGVVVPGGVSCSLTPEHAKRIVSAMGAVEKEMREIVAIAHASDGLMERLETTGVLTQEAALAYGAQGVPARASGVARDGRKEHPCAAYGDLGFSHVVTRTEGDVRARFDVRADELTESFRLVRSSLADLPEGKAHTPFRAKAGSGFGTAEGWLGEVVDWVRIDADGRIDRCVIRDPSFCNWALFGEIGPGNIVPDFPLCNKSLNLSYSGTDL